MNKWEEHLNVKYPSCKMTGNCCRMAIPSTPPLELLLKANKGDQFAKDFLSIFIPHNSSETIKQKAPEFYKSALELAQKSPEYSKVTELTFYYCRFISSDNHCLIYEDRPQLCRDYPDTPFLLMHPDCAFKQWSLECKNKYKSINTFLELLKDILVTLKNQDNLHFQPYGNNYLTSPGYTLLK